MSKPIFASQKKKKNNNNNKICRMIEYTANGSNQTSSDGWCALLCLVLHAPWKHALIGYYNAFKCSCVDILACLHVYMNIAMEQTEEYVNGQLKNKYSIAFILGNDGTLKDDSLFYCYYSNFLFFAPYQWSGYLFSGSSVY